MISSALLSRTLRSWVGNSISEFSWVVAQPRLLRDWCERDIVWCYSRFVCLMFRLWVTSQMHSDQLVAGLVQRTSWFLVSVPNHGGERSRMSTWCGLLTFVPLCDHKRIWYIADGSFGSLAKFFRVFLGTVFQLGGIFWRFPVLHFLAVPRRFPVLRNMAVPISAVPGTAKYCFPV